MSTKIGPEPELPCHCTTIDNEREEGESQSKVENEGEGEETPHKEAIDSLMRRIREEQNPIRSAFSWLRKLMRL